VAAALAVGAITRAGLIVDMALMRFLLFYAGVFALVGLTAAVGAGLIASDRIIMTPSRRVIAQAVHRGVSFGAVGFLVIHIISEVIAGRAQAGDAVVPFAGHPRTLYLGLGTLAADLFVLILVTGIMRGRFAAIRPPWAWRALHAAAYLAWPLAILHGLLDGRTPKPYVDLSYVACVAAVGLALIVRLVVPLRVQEAASFSAPAAPSWPPPGGAGGAALWPPPGGAGRAAQWPPPGGARGGGPPWLPAEPVPGPGGPPVPPGAFAGRPPRATPAPPGHAARAYPERSGGGHGYLPPGGSMVYYPGPDDEDGGPEWLDMEDRDANDLGWRPGG
jgi:hypothetical protein